MSQCESTKADPSTGEVHRCELELGHEGPHQAAGPRNHGVTRVHHWDLKRWSELLIEDK